MAMVDRRVRAVVGIIEASDGGGGDVVLDQLATLTAFISSSPVLVVDYLLLHRSQSDHLMSKRWSCLCFVVDLTTLYF